MKATLALLCVLALAYTAQAKDGIKCWTCGDEDISKCSESDQSTCDGYCSKTVADIAGLTLISRSCLPICTDANTSGNGLFCCEDDLCNGASTLSSFGLLAAIVAAIFARFM